MESRKRQNYNCKANNIDNHIKCDWMRNCMIPVKKAEIVRIRSNYASQQKLISHMKAQVV